MKKNIQGLLGKKQSKKYKHPIMYSNEIEIIIDDICAETGYSKMDVKKVVDSQFKMLKEVISSGGLITEDSDFENYKSIRLIRLGSFRPSIKKFEKIKEILDKGK